MAMIGAGFDKLSERAGLSLGARSPEGRSEMKNQYLITLQVKYEPYATDAQRSLSWLAPELVGAQLTLTEDDDTRRWVGVIDANMYTQVVGAWSSEGLHRVFDGMEFEVEGSSPIVYVTLDTEPQPAYAAA
jgi:hypothetical protein